MSKANLTVVGSKNLLRVYFFKSGLLSVRLAQLLLGSGWNAPSHVIYELNEVSYEITKGGLVVGQRASQALYRSCLDCFSLELTDAQVFVFKRYMSDLKEERFSLLDCISFVWRLHSQGFFSIFACAPELPTYGFVARVQPYETVYKPPFSCTTPLWEALGEVAPAWNVFAPSVVYDHLTGTLEEL
jgi:hypothetical protein